MPAVPAPVAAVPAVPEAVPAVPAVPDNHVTVQSTERPIIITTERPKELHGHIVISHIPEEYSQNPDHIHHITGDTLFYKDLGKITTVLHHRMKTHRMETHRMETIPCLESFSIYQTDC